MSRRLLASSCACAIVAVASSVGAQGAHLTAREVAQIANVALRVVVAPDSTFSGISASRRGVGFNVRQSLAAFGAPISGDTAVRFDRAVDVVSDSVLSDCSQIVPKPCAGLGSRVYVSISPLSVTASQAHVQVVVFWATRVGSAPREHAYLSGIVAGIQLRRDATGSWVLYRRDPEEVVM